MTQRTAQEVRAEAIGWHLRLREDSPGDWDDFVRWLEEDPANSHAFDAVQRADAAVTPASMPAHGLPEPANDDRAGLSPRKSWSAGGYLRFGAGALVASLLLMVFIWPVLGGRGPDRHEIATVAGQHRTVDLGDGSAAVLYGSTRLILDHNDPRSVELAAGEATFTIRHDQTRPFTVVADGHRLQDVGTRFNLIAEPGRFEVAVIEGAVLYDPEGRRVSLGAGQALAVRGDREPVLSRDDPTRFAGWRNGRLNYTSAPLEAVASDLSRSLGTRLRVDPRLRALSFTGSIRIQGDRDATIAAFAATLDLRARREGDSWLIEPQARAPR
jgi:transmembrane sensor